MKRVVGVVAGASVIVAGLAVPTAHAGPLRRAIMWGPCEQGEEPSRLECGTLRVPLDPKRPYGPTIMIALNRVRGGASRDGNHLGSLLVNPGGPGASGLKLTEHVAGSLPKEIAKRFDVIGFDPRGVGSSWPSINCVDPKVFFKAPRPGNVPTTRGEEAVLIGRARQYAAACGAGWNWFLPHLTTENTARDMEAIRAALGEDKISYLGYSYGTYLGSVYATLFPTRVRRLVLDSTVDPKGIWYDANIKQDYAFDRRHGDFLTWVARNNRIYHLGDTGAALSYAWYAMRRRLALRPAGGLVGASELDDVFTVGGYTNGVWPQLAQAFADYVREGDARGLVAAFRAHAEADAEAENGYAVYLGVQCRDAAWPRDWRTWHADTMKVDAKAPFMAWPNAVFNAPCAFWPQPGGTPVSVKAAKGLPPILMIQARKDAATPIAGALNAREVFPTARMLVEPGGNHGVALAGNKCVDKVLADYLRLGVLPAVRVKGRKADMTCPTLPDPRPMSRMASGGVLGHAYLTSLLTR